jgi:hypothetical protein
MIIMISPGKESYEHTLSTIQMADCMKKLAASDPMETSTFVSSVSETMEVEEMGSGSPATSGLATVADAPMSIVSCPASVPS